MTDRDFVNILRHCDTLDCQNCPYCTKCLQVDMSSDAVADRMERLLNENELLYREVAKLKAECDHFRDLTKKLWCEKRYGEDTNVPTKWVSVEERLPESDGQVLVTFTGKIQNKEYIGGYLLAEYVPGEGWILEEYPQLENPNVTHWCELPEPPSTEGVE